VRLFVALEVGSEVRDSLTGLIEELRAVDAAAAKNKARWVRVENLHMTLKFIGNVGDGRLDQIREALSEVRPGNAVEMRFRGLGFFPNDSRPRVLWAGVQAAPDLASLADEIDARLGQLDIPRETRKFTPHLTLARFDPPGISGELHTAAMQYTSRDFGMVRTGKFHLFESKTRPTGAEYTRLSSFAFAEGKA
jgi:RNA 2',3'-cyclic 3'-phosphodiesterase